MIDTTFTYKPKANRLEAFCRLRIYRHDDRTVVIATEPADNTGMSITNAAEELAAQVCDRYNIAPSELIWIEHYGPDYVAKYRPDSEETYDSVRFTWDGERFRSPRWSPSSREAIEGLAGEPL